MVCFVKMQNGFYMRHVLQLKCIFAIVLTLALLCIAIESNAQLQFYDDFEYNTGNLSGNGNWTQSGTGPNLAVTSSDTSLVYGGYNGGGGNYVVAGAPSSTASNYYKPFTTATTVGTNVFYYSMLLRVTKVSTAGEYFFAINNGSTAYISRLFAKSNGAGYSLGVSTAANPKYAIDILNFNQTYLVVVSYEGISGGNLAKLWINPTLTANLIGNVTPNASDTTTTNAGVTFSNFIWRNMSTNTPAIIFDGLRLAYGTTSGNAWSNLAAQASVPPIVTATTPTASVDNYFTITYPTNSAYTSAITAIRYKGILLTQGTDYVLSGNNTITFTPSNNSANVLRTAGGAFNITITATGYSVATVAQTLTAGLAANASINMQPLAPTTNGGLLLTQPAILVTDQFGNVVSGAVVNATVLNSQTASWSLGGTTSVTSNTSGIATFTNLTATNNSGASFNNATLQFTLNNNVASVNANAFTIPVPPPNDACNNAIALTVGAAATLGNLSGSTNTNATLDRPDVWYTFTPNCSGTDTIAINYGASGVDIDFEVYVGASCPVNTTGRLVNSNGRNTTSEISTGSFTANTAYYIRVIDYAYNGSPASNFTIQVKGIPQLTLTNAATPAAGNIGTNSNNAVVFGFTTSPNCNVSTYDLNVVTITTSGTTTNADLSNFRIFYDANANGIIDNVETSVTGLGIALATNLVFTFANQTGLTGIRNYLLVADIAANAVVGRTFIGSISPVTNLSTSINPTGATIGTVTGNVQTIAGFAYYWNGGSNNANPAVGGTGNWSDANNWRQPTATGSQATWQDGNPAYLGGTGGTVTLNTSIVASNINIASTNYTLTTSGSSPIGIIGAINLANTLTISPVTSASLTINGVLSGSGGITKSGAGTLLLNNTHTFSGNTSVAAGVLNVSGTLSAASVVNINSNATLAGTGAVKGNILVNGTISPNTSGTIGTLTTGILTLNTGGYYYVDVRTIPKNGQAGVDWDNIIADGIVNNVSSGQFTISLNGTITNFSAITAYTWQIGCYAGAAPANTNIVVSSLLTNALNGGSFSVTFSNNIINLIFTPASCNKVTSGTALWDFGTGAGRDSTSSTVANVSFSAMTQRSGAATLNNTSFSTGYSGATGNNNASITASSGALDISTSAYFQFTITPSTNYSVGLTGISFGSRSTGTGPTKFAIRSSANNYATDLASGDLVDSSKWALKSTTITASASAVGTAISYRIYGYNGSSSAAGNWRIDDVQLTLSVTTGIDAPVITSLICENSTMIIGSSTAANNSTVIVYTNGIDAGTANVINGTWSASVAPLAANTTLTATVSNSNSCASNYSASVGVAAAPVITVQPSMRAVCNVDTALFQITATGTSLSYQWQINTGNGWADLANVSPHNGVTTNSLLVKPIVTAMYNNLYRVKINGVCGSAITSSPTQFIAENTWSGAGGNANWQNSANWACGTVPVDGANVTIAQTASVYPVITGTVSVNTIAVQAGASLIVTGGLLKIADSINNKGELDIKNGGLEWNGTVTQKLQANLLKENTLKHGVIRNAAGVVLAAPLTLTGFLSIPSGTLDLGNSNITFQSGTIANTGQLGLVGGNIVYSGTGRFVVERLLNSTRRGYRNISSGGVLTDGTIFDNWQEGGASPSGYGTSISGAKSNTPGIDATTGFDYTRTGNPSLWTYSNTDAFTPVANTKATQLLPFTGYFALVRGDRNYDLYSAAPNLAVASTTLRTTGKLVTGTVTLSSNANPVCTAGGNTVSSTFRLNNNTTPSGKNPSDYGFSLIGNPYACAINWGSIHSRSNGASYSNGHLSPYYWVWNQSVNGGLGAWITAHTTGQTNVNPGSGNAAGNGTSVTGSYNNQYIQPGQSFFIQNDNTSNNLVLEIQESDKYVSDNANLKGVFDAVTPPTTEINAIRFNLVKYPYTDTAVLTDGSLVLLDATYRNAIDKNDAVKLENPTENIAINKEGTRLSIESRSLFTVKDTVAIRLWKVQPNIPYQLWIDGSLYKGNNVQAYVLDKQTNTKTAIGTAGTYGTNFTPTADSGSYANRFQIVFDTLQTLPIVFTGITAQAVQNTHQPSNRISWQVASASGNGIERYVVERSSDGKTFGSIGSITANAATQMVFTDVTVSNNTNPYYRIAAVGNNGTTIAYSQVVQVQSSKQAMQVGIYPNQISNNSCKVVFRNAPQGSYQLVLHNLLGEKLATANLWHSGSNAEQVVRLGTTHLTTGMYSVQIWLDGTLVDKQWVWVE